jgi:PAS domain S-box-containing protein
MNDPIRILVVEDNPLDKKLIEAHIMNAHLKAEMRLVETQENYLNELKNFRPDVVISDYFMDGFNGMDVLNLHKKEAPDTPFIFITGQLREETAIKCLEHGAQDYIMKDHLKRLPVAVKNVLMLRDEKQVVNQKQKALEESEKRYRTLSELTFEGVAIHHNGILLDCNLSFCRMFGYKREELIGNNIIEMLIHQDDREKMLQNIRQGYTKPYESRGIRIDGTIFPIEQEAREIEIEGKKVRSVAFRDITDRKQTLENLKLSEEKFQKISNSATDAIILIDHEGNISFWNSAATQMFGYKPQEVMGKNLHHLLAPEKYREAYTKGFNNFIVTGEGTAVGKITEVEAVKKDGEIVPMELALSSLKIHDQWHAVGILRDITARKKSEQEMLNAQLYAEEMSKMKSNFLTAASHELRTPLNGLLGFVEIINENITDPEIREFVDLLRYSGRRMLNTVNLIVGLAEIDSNVTKVSPAPEDIATIVEEICEEFLPEAQDKNIYLNFQIQVSDPVADLDKMIFSNALTNLVSNAVKFTQKGGVSVKLTEKKINDIPIYAITIKDTGIGIPEDKIPIIYNEFRQASEGYNRAFEGIGLGLHVTKKYVDLMKGFISLKTQAGKGSEFVIHIPKYYNDSLLDLATEHQESPVGINAAKKPSILYVEDDHIHRMFMTTVLQKDYLLVCAENGKKALELIKSKDFDMILMDINLGIEMNGLEVIKKIRENESYKTIPIAAITANAMLSQKSVYLKNGCNDFLPKPFKKKDIIRLIEKNLTKSGFWDE